MAKLKKFKSRKEWLQARRQGVGGSDAPAIVGVDPYRSALEVYAEKLDIGEPQEDTDILWWGRKLQPIVAQAYRRETGRKLEYFGNHFFVSDERPNIFASLDALILEPKSVLEIKTSEVVTGRELEEGIPLNWQVQLQHCLGVMRLEIGSFAVALPHRKLFYVDVPADKEFIALLFEKEDAFMKQVRERRPPDPDASDSARETLRKMYPSDSGQIIALPADAIEWDRLRTEADSEIKRWTEQKIEAENKIKAAIGEATFGEFDNVKYSWKVQPRAGYTVEPTKMRILRRLNNEV